jgi:two-component system response regulator FlrC
MTPSRILLVEDDAALRDALRDTLSGAGWSVRTAAGAKAAEAAVDEQRPDLVVSDVRMDGGDGFDLLASLQAREPALPVVLMTAYGTVERAVEAMRRGAVDYLVKPFEAETLVEVCARYLPAASSRDPQVERAPEDEAAEALCCRDRATRELAGMVLRIARTDATVLFTGESGSGKEVFARYVHDHSERAGGPFVALNCAAIPESLMEATLFGYNRGAFTGAHESRPGKFEQANGGTLLLDEISEMDVALQAKLLRVLQEREVERLGGQRPVDLDVRVLATSNRDLREEVAAGRFREDLFYRLNVVRIHIPPLRQRPSDILPLARRLLAQHAGARKAPSLTRESECVLTARQWPGNVRELENVMQRALILHTGATIRPADLRFEPIGMPQEAPESAPRSAPAEADGRLENDLRAREAELIFEALRAGNGNRQQAAERLGISPRTLRYKLARLRELGIAIS